MARISWAEIHQALFSFVVEFFIGTLVNIISGFSIENYFKVIITGSLEFSLYCFHCWKQSIITLLNWYTADPGHQFLWLRFQLYSSTFKGWIKHAYLHRHHHRAIIRHHILRLLGSNLRRLHRSKKNYRNIIVIGQIIGSGQIIIVKLSLWIGWGD